MPRQTAHAQLQQLKQYLSDKALPSNKHYTCVCGAILAHDEVRPHWVKCPSQPRGGYRCRTTT